MNIKVNVPLKMEGIVTVQGLDGQGNVLHQEVKKNLITNLGWGALTEYELGDELTYNCVLGRANAIPTLNDKFFGGVLSAGATMTAPYSPSCPDDPPNSACNAAPFRSVVARSTDHGGTLDAFALTDSGGETYWQLTRKRIFEYSYDYFRAGDGAAISGTCAAGEPLWVDQGWGLLSREACLVREVGFVSDSVDVAKNFVTCVTVPQWNSGVGNSGRLWNRVALATSIGFDSGASVGGVKGDVLLPLDGLIKVSLELRVHVDKTPVVQVIDIDGTPTTVTTQIQDLASTLTWAQGFIRHFGAWGTNINSARIAEDNNAPATAYDKYNFDGQQSTKLESEMISWGTSYVNRRYVIPPAKGNWVGGIGGIEHANFSSDFLNPKWTMCTVFNPKFTKTDLQQVNIDVHYTWSES